MVYRNAGSVSLLIQFGIGVLAAVVVMLNARWDAVRENVRIALTRMRTPAPSKSSRASRSS